MDGVTRRVPCSWQLLGLAVKEPWLAPSGSIPALAAQTGLESTTLTFWGGSFQAGKAAWALSGYLPTEYADELHAC